MKLSTYQLINSSIRFRQGYIAITSVLVIAVVVLTIGVSISLLAINEVQTSLAGTKSEEAVSFVESCVEEALLELNNDNSISTEITLPEGTCSATINLVSGDEWTFTVIGSVDNYVKSVRVTANRSASLTVTSWQEVE
jgi:hypothetical protein